MGNSGGITVTMIKAHSTNNLYLLREDKNLKSSTARTLHMFMLNGFRQMPDCERLVPCTQPCNIFSLHLLLSGSSTPLFQT